MTVQKISISLPSDLVRFIEQYKNNQGCGSRSQVVETALLLLQERELAIAYQQANQEIDSDWDITVGDGLGDETW